MSGLITPMKAIPTPRRFSLFEYGFRPFFLLAGLYALFAVPLWLWVWSRGISPLRALPPMLWHGHEMLYGFVVAAIAGFLLTAVPSWTGARGFAGRPLRLLVAAWLAGRLAFIAAMKSSDALLAQRALRLAIDFVLIGRS